MKPMRLLQLHLTKFTQRNPANVTSHFHLPCYNGNGQQTSVTDALGRLTSFEYDDNNRLTKTTFHDDTYTTMEYDELGRRVSATDQEGNRGNRLLYISIFILMEIL